MDPTVARRRFAAERVARLATVGPGGQPHLVPVTFAVLDAVGDGVIVFAVDHKPKRARQLRRLRNIAASPLVSFLVDHYTEEWSELWWVRADAIAEIVPADAGDSRFVAALEALAERAEIPLLTTSYADPIVQRGLKYTFKLPPQGSSLAELQMAYIGELMKELKGQAPKRAAVFVGSDSASQSLLKATLDLAGKYGFEIVSQISFQSGLTDPTQIVSASLQNRPDVIFLSSFTSDVILVTRALRAVNITVPVITGGGGVSTDTIGATLGKASENLMGIVCWNWDLPIDGVKQVLDGYKELEPKAPFPPASETIGTGYTLGMVIRAALEKAGTDDPKKVRETLASLEVAVPMPGGKIAFAENGQNKFIQPIMVGWIDGQLRTVWPKQYQAAKPKL